MSKKKREQIGLQKNIDRFEVYSEGVFLDRTYNPEFVSDNYQVIIIACKKWMW